MLLIPRMFKRKARYVGEGYKLGDYGKVSARNIRSERMSSQVELPIMDGSNIYDASTMGVQRRRQRRSDKYHPAMGRYDTGRVRPVSRDGLSGTAFCLAIALLISALGVACLVDRSQVIEISKNVASLEKRIDDGQSANQALEMQVHQRAAEINVGYEAAQMGMISAKGTDVVYLLAPESAYFTLPTGTNSVALESLATILGD